MAGLSRREGTQSGFTAVGVADDVDVEVEKTRNYLRSNVTSQIPPHHAVGMSPVIIHQHLIDHMTTGSLCFEVGACESQEEQATQVQGHVTCGRSALAQQLNTLLRSLSHPCCAAYVSVVASVVAACCAKTRVFQTLNSFSTCLHSGAKTAVLFCCAISTSSRINQLLPAAGPHHVISYHIW